jgi:hypothetical protein
MHTVGVMHAYWVHPVGHAGTEVMHPFWMYPVGNFWCPRQTILRLDSSDPLQPLPATLERGPAPLRAVLTERHSPRPSVTAPVRGCPRCGTGGHFLGWACVCLILGHAVTGGRSFT